MTAAGGDRTIRAQPGPQEAALASPADIVIFGGAAGCGKTWTLLLEPIRHLSVPTFSAVIFRRTYPEITDPGGLWDESGRLYRHLGGAPRQSPAPEWVFPSGARVRFSHMQHADDRFLWKGSQVALFEFDQLEAFEEKQFWYMLSRNRDPSGRVRPYIRASCNPVPDDDLTGGWLNRLIRWWLDRDGAPIPERSGVLRWFVRDDDRLAWGADPAAVARYGAEPKSITFIPGKLDDNPALLRADPAYRSNLLALGAVERAQLLGGNWNARPQAGKVFNRAWFRVVAAAPRDARRVRYWDKAGTEGGGAWTAGVRMAEADGVYYVEDVRRGQWSSRRRNEVVRQTADEDGLGVPIWVEQEPGSGGKESAEISVRELAGYVVRAEPVTGDKVARAGPLSAQAEAGNVQLVAGPWVADYLTELHAFPDGRYKDQVDASSGAFNKLALGASRRLDAGVLGGPAAPRRVTVRG